jgi:hypothetical protein
VGWPLFRGKCSGSFQFTFCISHCHALSPVLAACVSSDSRCALHGGRRLLNELQIEAFEGRVAISSLITFMRVLDRAFLLVFILTHPVKFHIQGDSLRDQEYVQLCRVK